MDKDIYARLLVLYETLVSEKLNSTDLQRIYDTYKDKKIGKLEKDLIQKYPMLPTYVPLSEVSRYASSSLTLHPLPGLPFHTYDSFIHSFIPVIVHACFQDIDKLRHTWRHPKQVTSNSSFLRV